MSAEIINFSGVTSLDMPPDRILGAAIEAKLAEVVIVGIDVDGNEYFASSQADAGNVVWHLERAKWRLMRQVDDMSGEAE